MQNYPTPTWGDVETYLRREIDARRARNDDPALDANATAALRGEILALKKLLGLPKQLALEKQREAGLLTASAE